MTWVWKVVLECGCAFSNRGPESQKDHYSQQFGELVDCSQHGPQKMTQFTARGN